MPDHLRHRRQPRETSRPDHSAEGLSRRAFTLIELLVVVAIVAIIFLMLIPVVLDKEPRGPAGDCRSNLHQNNVALIMWQTDHASSFPWQVSTTNGGTMELIASGDAFPHVC